MKFEGKAYIYTIGCQMNVYDSERIGSVLASMGYRKTDASENADIVVCNTCTIREKAQQKAFSFLGRFAREKKKRPGLITVMAGCVAQQEGEGAFRRLPHLDIVLGTRSLSRLAGHIKDIKNGRARITDIESSSDIFETVPAAGQEESGQVSRFVTIMQGCENFCTYCVVPYVRGREKSRSPESILEEIGVLAGQGVKEVTLLGQNVNSYGAKENSIPFFRLLEMVNAIESLERIRFATSHPKDLSDDLIGAVRDLEKVCRHVHLPVQSGSDRILKKMNRGYTRWDYLERISRLKKECPDISLSSDFIVGFPSETQADFQMTLDLLDAVGFDSVFAFSYSDRKIAPAAKFEGKVAESEKLRRLNTLLQHQGFYTHKSNENRVGNNEKVLVEGRSQKQMPSETAFPGPGVSADSPQMTGRTESNKIVHFPGKGVKKGEMVNLKITAAYPHSLWGTVEGFETYEEQR